MNDSNPCPESLVAGVFAENPALIAKIRRVLFCDEDEARQALQETIRFMTLVAEHACERLTPSHRVDLTWHEFILFTRAYGKFCAECFGRFIHHQPDENHSVNQEQHEKTQRLYRERFGPLPEKFWASGRSTGAFCGNCKSPGD